MGLTSWVKGLVGGNQRTTVGLLIFLALFLWVVGALVGLTFWGARTWPSIEDAQALSEGTDEDALAVYRSLRTQWLTEIKELGTTLTLTPATALISAVIGFLLRGEHDGE